MRASSSALAATRSLRACSTSGAAPKNRSAGTRPSIPTVRAPEVVPVDEVADPRTGVGQVEEHGRFQALPPERAPEPFDLAQRLRMPRCGHDLLDAALLELLVKRALAPPGDVLRAVVGEHFLGARRR